MAFPTIHPKSCLLFEGNDDQRRTAFISISNYDSDCQFAYKIKTDASKEKLCATPHSGFIDAKMSLDIKVMLAPITSADAARVYTIKVLLTEVTSLNKDDVWNKTDPEKILCHDITVLSKCLNFVSKIPKFVGFDANGDKGKGHSEDAPPANQQFKLRTPRFNYLKKDRRTRSEQLQPLQVKQQAFNWGAYLQESSIPWSKAFESGDNLKPPDSQNKPEAAAAELKKQTDIITDDAKNILDQVPPKDLTALAVPEMDHPDQSKELKPPTSVDTWKSRDIPALNSNKTTVVDQTKALEISLSFFREALFVAVAAAVGCLIIGNVMGKLGI